MKHSKFFKSTLAVLLIAGAFVYNGINVEANTTPSGVVGGTSVYGRTTIGLNNATASTLTTPADYGVYCKVSASYNSEHPTTHATYPEHKETYGYGSAGVSFVAPSAYESKYVDATHYAEKYSQKWSDYSSETYP